jgi:hypothetical protein
MSNQAKQRIRKIYQEKLDSLAINTAAAEDRVKNGLEAKPRELKITKEYLKNKRNAAKTEELSTPLPIPTAAFKIDTQSKYRMRAIVLNKAFEKDSL